MTGRNHGLPKLNSMRILEAQGIPYVCRTYDTSGEFHSATEAAELLGVPPSSVYKTLVVLRDIPTRPQPLLVMISSEEQLDLKELARSLGEKRLRMATQREAESLTGLQVGGISPLALVNRGFQVCIDKSALQLERVHISGGQRGIDLEIDLRQLMTLLRARVVPATVDIGAKP